MTRLPLRDRGGGLITVFSRCQRSLARQALEILHLVGIHILSACTGVTCLTGCIEILSISWKRRQTIKAGDKLCGRRGAIFNPFSTAGLRALIDHT